MLRISAFQTKLSTGSSAGVQLICDRLRVIYQVSTSMNCWLCCYCSICHLTTTCSASLIPIILPSTYIQGRVANERTKVEEILAEIFTNDKNQQQLNNDNCSFLLRFHPSCAARGSKTKKHEQKFNNNSIYFGFCRQENINIVPGIRYIICFVSPLTKKTPLVRRCS